MATFYVGYRSVLRGRNANNFVHSTKNKVGVYSNYSLMDNGPELLSGFPDNERNIGTDTATSKTGIMQWLYTGKPHVAPMVAPGSGTRLDYARYRPFEYKGLAGAKAFPTGYGHVVRGDIFTFSNYSNFVYDGLDALEALKGSGHVRRFSTTYGGAFDPYVNKGVSVTALANAGSALPTGYNNAYGKNKVNEWRGVPSSRAL